LQSNGGNQKQVCNIITNLLLEQAYNLNRNLLKQEIDNDRPMVFLTGSNGDGRTDHFVTIDGYRTTSGNNEYGCLDTYQPIETIRWEQFRTMSSAYKWGIWKGWGFQIEPPITPPAPNSPTTFSIDMQYPSKEGNPPDFTQKTDSTGRQKGLW
jgi:hypothetical protein